MKQDTITVILKGMWVGGTMTVPGVSGGSMAMIAGIYASLIRAVGTFFTDPVRHGIFLGKFLLGAAAGIVLFSKLITYLLASAVSVPLRFFFLGAVAGGIPMICKRAGINRLRFDLLAWPMAGILAVELLALLPQGLIAPGAAKGLGGLMLQTAGGFLIAVGLVLPGISVSQMLYMLGIYETVIENVSAFHFLTLIPLGIGVVGGSFLTAGLLERWMSRQPGPAYLLILGFMMGSLPELFPGIPTGRELIFSLLAAVIGFFALYLISEKQIQ